MNRNRIVFSRVLFAVAFVLLCFALVLPRTTVSTGHASKRIEKIVEKRTSILDNYIQLALEGNTNEWMELGKLPSDMVVYRYVDNNLQSWNGQFPVLDDEIVNHGRQRFPARRNNSRAYLAEVGHDYSYLNFGGYGSYLVRRIDRGNVSVVAGLNLGESPYIEVDNGYTFRSLSSADGTLVNVDGKPAFRLMYDGLPQKSDLPTNLAIFAFLVFALASLFSLSCTPRVKYCILAIVAFVAASIGIYSFHGFANDELESISIILVINALLTLISLSLYICRRDIWKKVKKTAWVAILSVLDILAIVGVYVFAYLAMFKISVYTHISLDLTKPEILGAESVLLYVSLLTLSISTVFLAQLLQPVLSKIAGRHLNLLSRWGCLVSALFIAAFIVGTNYGLGFSREQLIVSSWAESLANDRSFAFEESLKRVEKQIASDEVFARYSASDEFEPLVRDRLFETYLGREMMGYDLAVKIGNDTDVLGLDSGVQIDRNSRFFYAPLGSIRCRYIGVFQYYLQDSGQNTIYFIIEKRFSEKQSSITSILGYNSSNDFEVPSRYSYAKYKDGERLYYKGSYAYPTKLTEGKLNRFRSLDEIHIKSNGYIHFVNKISDDEIIVISRPHRGNLIHILAICLVAIIIFIFLNLFSIRKRTVKVFERNSFKKTINIALIVSLALTMTILAAFSVTFVYDRNESNARSMMSDKASSIRLMLQAGLRNVQSADDIVSRETLDLIRRVGDNTASDISIYRTDGKILLSTTPELYFRRAVGTRLDETAFEHIMYLHEGFCVQKTKYGQRRFYTMYAPLIGPTGEIIAIFSSPYMDNNYDFELDAALHSIGIIILFLILLFISIAVVSSFVDKTFKPLSEMSRKMKAGGHGNLEHITYDRQDEISSLVQSYNRMVDDLSESTRALALAERDKAWSEMARNVAHEIKNPLTPMQLQIQRVQRLKANGDERWQERFDDMAKVLLDHIEVLTETANQFSDFAKLYSEEPVEIDLDALLREEVALYDNRPGVEFEYLGLSGAKVSGPRPQLVRVFVNLLNNSIQALEGAKGEKRIMVSLRNAVDSNYYDIVFEDNGPGVDAENIDKLFTPKFTTKSSGSGLGLSICRSILERCGATIEYSRSFSLTGACFTIRYPKNFVSLPAVSTSHENS